MEIFGQNSTLLNTRDLPFIVQIDIKKNGENFRACQGTVLTTSFILAAAHCLYGKNESGYEVIGNDHPHSLPSSNPSFKHFFNVTRTKKNRKLEKIYVHPLYNESVNPSFHDIALIETETPVFQNHVFPSSWIATSTFTPKGQNASLFRWEKNETEILKTGIKAIKVKLLDQKDCGELLIEHFPDHMTNITEFIICGEYENDNEEIDICDEDYSWGPLICKANSSSDMTDDFICGLPLIDPSTICAKHITKYTFYTSIGYYWPWLLKEISSTYFIKKPPLACSEGEFHCGNLKCIKNSTVCDYTNDCGDGSDETNCHPCTYDFRCKNKKCILKAFVCDRDNDCIDGSDEVGCSPCQKNEFKCKYGPCINSTLICNGVDDCGDNSDELRCPKCVNSFFNCPNSNTCLNETSMCDGLKDCKDGADEINCGLCSIYQFRCKNGKCIDKRYICDYDNDCQDASDEMNCGTCERNQIRCVSSLFGVYSLNSTCVDATLVCNGQKDCKIKGNDELGCKNCAGSEFSCLGEGCFGKNDGCNGVKNCKDGSDELNCLGCGQDEFICKTGHCINSAKMCDGERDCRTGEDEFNCKNCTYYQFACKNGNCVYGFDICNGINDCGDGSDELNCKNCPTYDHDCKFGRAKAKAIPRFQNVSIGFSISNCGPNGFQCNNKFCIPMNYRCDKDKDCVDGSDELNCEDYCLYGNTEGFKCKNGVCLSMDRRCDKMNNCGDGSDEIGCSSCQPNEFQCMDGKCINSHLVCNSQTDCQDKSDEIGCGKCSHYSYACESGNQCVGMMLLCDGKMDCKDESDEENCKSNSHSIFFSKKFESKQNLMFFLIISSLNLLSN